ncbi:MAG: sulfotransferase [Myxococcales bacterium]|nr:sulfotransferase [Myxococcales bacterium]
MDLSPLRMGVRTVTSSFRQFGPRQTALQLGLLSVLVTGRSTLALDDIFHRAYRDVRVDRPCFIIGAPRSGTTFFHRLLTQTDEFPHWQTWELLLPSLTARKLLRPIVPKVVSFLGRGFKDDSTLFDGNGHETTITSIEEEEVLFLLRLDTQFVNLFTPVAFDAEDLPEIVYNDEQPRDRRLASGRFFADCLRRQIHLTGRTQVLAKMPYSTMRVRTLLEVFPDARFVYLVRSPFETLPSHMTLHRGFFEQRYGIENIPPDVLARYWQRRYRYNVALYRYFHDVMAEGGVPSEQVLTIRFPELLDDLQGVFDRLLDFTGFTVSDELRRRVADRAARQKHYNARHQNLDLEAFGIDREQVLADLGFVFDEYGFDPDPTGA